MDLERAFSTIKKRLHSLENGPAAESLRSHGQTYKYIFGLSLENIKMVAKDYYPNSELARLLWSKDGREFKILATCIESPKTVRLEQLKQWSLQVNEIELAEQLVINLLSKYPDLELYLAFISQENTVFSKKIFSHLLAWLSKKPQNVDLNMIKNYLPILIEKLDGKELFIAKSIAFAFRSALSINQEMYDVVKQLVDAVEDNTDAKKVFKEELKWALDPEFVRFIM